jgi:hypothetical protein
MPFPIADGQAAVTRTLSGCLHRLEVELPGFQEDPKPDKLQVWVCEGVAEGGACGLALVVMTWLVPDSMAATWLTWHIIYTCCMFGMLQQSFSDYVLA